MDMKHTDLVQRLLALPCPKVMTTGTVFQAKIQPCADAAGGTDATPAPES